MWAICYHYVELEYFNSDSNLIVRATGTFTLSNLGMFGVDRFDAILPPGQVSDDFWDFWSLMLLLILWHVFIWGLNFALLFISRVLSWLLEHLSPLFWLIKMDSSAWRIKCWWVTCYIFFCLFTHLCLEQWT